jgi:5'-nucleotidase
VTLSKLDLTSLGSPVNTEVSAVFEGSSAAAVTSPVVAGASTVAFTVPSDIGGEVILVITATESGTVVRVPLTLAALVPDPGTEEPGTEEPGTELPVAAPTAAGELSLVAGLEGGIVLSDNTVVPGQIITVNVGVEYAGQYVAAFLYPSQASLTGWVQVDAAGLISVKIPTDVPVGSYRLAVQAADGSVIGWVGLTVLATPGSASASLASTGVDASPALLVAFLLMSLGAALALTRRRRFTGRPTL